MKLVTQSFTLFFVSALIIVPALSMSPGCNQKEKVLDIETPGAEVEVTRDTTDGEIEIDVDDK